MEINVKFFHEKSKDKQVGRSRYMVIVVGEARELICKLRVETYHAIAKEVFGDRLVDADAPGPECVWYRLYLRVGVRRKQKAAFAFRVLQALQDALGKDARS